MLCKIIQSAPCGSTMRACTGPMGKVVRSRSLKRTETGAVETKQAFVCTNPQIAVRGLRQRGHCAAIKASIAEPALTKVLRNGSIGIDRVSRA